MRVIHNISRGKCKVSVSHKESFTQSSLTSIYDRWVGQVVGRGCRILAGRNIIGMTVLVATGNVHGARLRSRVCFSCNA